MKHCMVSTRNVRRIHQALKTITGRLDDPEIMGIGIITGPPGLGKSLVCEQFYVKHGDRFRVAWLRALEIWTPSRFLQSTLMAIGVEPSTRNGQDLYFDLRDQLANSPALFLIDEIHIVAGRTVIMEMIKAIHDEMQSAFALIGEVRAHRHLKRHISFYDRVNRDAIVEALEPNGVDVAEIINNRCDVPVHSDVCEKIAAGSTSVRRVVDTIREIETYCRTNGLKSMTLKAYQTMTSLKGRQTRNQTTLTPVKPSPSPVSDSVETANV